VQEDNANGRLFGRGSAREVIYSLRKNDLGRRTTDMPIAPWRKRSCVVDGKKEGQDYHIHEDFFRGGEGKNSLKKGVAKRR